MEPSWEWRRSYRVWQANRQVFLYPENWIEPELRPPSSPQFQLEDIIKMARAQRTSVMFTATRPETATLAARALAAALGRDLYRVGLTKVVSKYIGETEKNLNRVFAAAAKARAVLLFDEADALFGNRTDAASGQDRFANQEVGFLLARIEAFDGLVILSSNLDPKTGQALAARFAFLRELPS
jgi:SpoVK/Ycf46/Vps4 family AAA+-type ATPase